MKNIHAIRVKYLGPTNHRGSRIKITQLWNGKSRIFDYKYIYNGVLDQAHYILRDYDLNCVIDYTQNEYYILAIDFKEGGAHDVIK